MVMVHGLFSLCLEKNLVGFPATNNAEEPQLSCINGEPNNAIEVFFI